MGRPSSYTKGKADAICERLARGESLRTICAGADMPDMVTERRWRRGNEDYRTHYARAREDQARGYADEIMDIADESVETQVEVQDKRVRIDTRKWTLSKLLPKTYGDKLEVSADTNLTIRVVREDIGQLNGVEDAEIIADNTVTKTLKPPPDDGKHGIIPLLGS